MKILTVPADTSVLRSKSTPIEVITPELIAFLKDLGDTLRHQHDPDGVGLSAVQVGTPIRVFATLLPPEASSGGSARGETGKKEKPELVFYINPEIVDHSKEMTLGEDLVGRNKKLLEKNLATTDLRPFLEGCLSIPAIYGAVPRWEWIKAKAEIITESQLSQYSVSSIQYSVFSLGGLASRVFQHELDHLNGVLFIDHTLKVGLPLYRQEEKDFVEMEV